MVVVGAVVKYYFFVFFELVLLLRCEEVDVDRLKLRGKIGDIFLFSFLALLAQDTVDLVGDHCVLNYNLKYFSNNF